MWEKDFDPAGFEWIDCDDAERSILSFERRGNDPDDRLVFVCNFTEAVHHTRIGVPLEGEYEEVFNSDSKEYGGSGVINEGVFVSEEIQCSKMPRSIDITIPPLGFAVFKRKKK